MKRRHQQEVNEAKHHTDLVIMELRQSIELEKSKTIADFKKHAMVCYKQAIDIEKQRTVTETKKTQLCANCGKEAIFGCVSSTSYCEHPFQVNFESVNMKPAFPNFYS